MNIAINRRHLLAGAGALVVSITLPGVKARAAAAGLDSRLPLKPEQLATYISVNQDGSAVGWIGKVDMGQGTEIGWVKMIAEELDLDPARVTIVQGHTDVTINQGGAAGSTGIWKGGAAMRNAAAEARRVLVEMASEKLGVPVEQLAVNNGVITDKNDANKKVSYGELIGGRHFDVQLEWNKVIGSDLNVKGKAKPKSPSEYKIVGKPGTRRRDVPPKVLGTIEYMVDVKVPGMLHGRMIRPAVAGAVPTAVDEASLKDIPGAKVVWQKGFIGVVAPKEWDAIRAAEKLKVTWSDAKPPFPGNAGLYDYIRKASIVKRDDDVNVGNIEAGFANAAKVVEATYEWPFQSHAPMAPACGVADVRDGEATVWSGTQKPHYGQEGIAKMLDLPVEKVKVVSMSGPGSYGRNDGDDAAMDAAVLSKAVGKPVRVQGMRYEGHGWDPKAPASIHVSRAAIDKDGKVTAWHFDTKAFSKRDFLNNAGVPEHTLAGQLMDLPLKPVHLFGPPDESYNFASMRKTGATVPPLLDRASPLRTAHMRDPGGPQTHFAVESFMDEVALATNTDPVEFRLRYLKEPRDIAVIKAAAEKAGWKPRVGPRKEAKGDVFVGQGIAYAARQGTRVAIVADIEVNKATGKVWARRYTVAHDCGQIVAPDLLRQVIEGNIVQSTSRALWEEVMFDQKNVTSVDWKTYPILDMTEAPEAIDIILIDHPEIAPTGAGEAASRPTAGALANAIFDATGIRLRRAPFTPDRLKAGMA
ncbi:MAG: nicotinate dehydrogenase subunit [Alphaproteobacteria bacterium]|jgi:CO/xanthine dehydrogenase Mo-binding subunit|nr:nicotinate dehydrogenase subunit [Alphaproteobacteria bacterium]